MMTPTPHLRIITLILGIGVVLLISGCRKPTTSMYPQHTTPSSPNVATEPVSTESAALLRRQALETVRDYLTLLEREDYAGAYNMLSSASKDYQVLSAFEMLGKQGMPSFDLKSATVTVTGNTAKVVLQQVEDYATHGFHLVREDKTWRIVYRGGSPGSPYPDDRSGG